VVRSARRPSGDDDRQVVTLSHFLPRVELVFHDWEKFQKTGHGSMNWCASIVQRFTCKNTHPPRFQALEIVPVRA
jgi:hypothetical protein